MRMTFANDSFNTQSSTSCKIINSCSDRWLHGSREFKIVLNKWFGCPRQQWIAAISLALWVLHCMIVCCYFIERRSKWTHWPRLLSLDKHVLVGLQILPAKQLYNTAAVSLDEAKELELQARCCAERLELASWSVCTTRPHLQYYHHVMCAERRQKWAWHIISREIVRNSMKYQKHPPTVNPGSTTAFCADSV